ncbi:Ubiquitin domain-containing protein 2 [Bagarius yarrelli]|uniref:Ubiquitin domain-containing protein 2 n=1 Tax=Bagarius yarrelli TaxID=175774 RepID=A0A556V9J5_BAGYA|nr:Ubiquitin domain-containing protein 2 [Bagarius yarrelli]
MTDGQLRSKRDEFWDTAPAFEGRKEIWDALKGDSVLFMKRVFRLRRVWKRQRGFFSGRPLSDRMKLHELNISKDYVVQVIVSQPPPVEN